MKAHFLVIMAIGVVISCNGDQGQSRSETDVGGVDGG